MAHPGPIEPLAAELLEFWFADAGDGPERALARGAFWFESTAEADAQMRAQFGAAVDAALAGDLAHWSASPHGRLALVLLLDQLTRNLNRGTARAFAGDARALALTLEALELGEQRALNIPEQTFLMMPLEHAEDIAIQRRCLEAFGEMHEAAAVEWRGFTGHCLEANREHHDIIARFGRFPHRNDALSRVSTAAELDFLATGARRFGQ